MSTGRILAILLALLAVVQSAAADNGVRLSGLNGSNGVQFAASVQTAQQSNQRVIAPSMALSLALRYSPGSQGLDVTLVQGGTVYAVKLKTANRVHRVLVDARTGQILGN